MALTDSERAELDASPQLAKFNKVLALYSYNAIAFVGHGQSLSDIYDRIAIATVTTTNASIELSEQCGDGCYWDQELGVCVCQGGFQTQADAQSASAREKKSSGKTKKTGNNKGKKAEKAKKGGSGK